MKNLTIYVILTIIMAFFFFEIHQEKKVKNYNLKLKDSIEHLSAQVKSLQGEKYYLNTLNDAYSTYPAILQTSGIETFTLSEGIKTASSNLGLLLSQTKKNLIIRYTEIGCSACIDSTFKVIRHSKKLAQLYNIIVLVDFDNYEYFVKWKKIADVENDIYWVKKGAFKFTAESGNESYLFVADRNSTREFFVPNSMYVSYLRNYVRKLEQMR